MIKLSRDTRINYGDNIKDAEEGVGWKVSKDKNEKKEKKFKF